jgi:hypothetical protein
MNTAPTFDSLKLEVIQNILASSSTTMIQQISDLVHKNRAFQRAEMRSDSPPIATANDFDPLPDAGSKRHQALSFGEYLSFEPLEQDSKSGHDFP